MPEEPGKSVDPYCKVFLDGPAAVEEAVAVVAVAVAGEPGAGEVTAPGLQILVEESDDHSVEAKRDFPTGYFEFQFLVEFLFEAGTGLDTAAQITTGVLEAFWGQHWAAVAACSYDERLAHLGGFNAPTLPWPGRT